MAEKELKVRPIKVKVLFIAQEFYPFTPQTEIASLSRKLPQSIQEHGKEIRIMMPKYGLINERSHQLHEVYRLSNLLLNINGDDKPLLLKVAALQAAKLQIYFIDNEELFKRKHIIRDEQNAFFADNDERIFFFCKGVLETVKQLNWSPDIILCQGWMASLIPLLVKTKYKSDPLFAGSKVVYTLFNDDFTEMLDTGYQKKLIADGIAEKEMKELADPSFESISKNAISKSDAVIIGSTEVKASILNYATASGLPVLDEQSTDNFESTNAFFDGLLKK